MQSDESLLMEPLQLAGRIIMENGGETFRAEDTVLRMGRAIGLDQVDCFAIPSGLFISYRKSDGSSESTVSRIRRGGTNLTRINEVNHISRRLTAHELTAAEATEQLREISHDKKPYSGWQLVLASAVCAGGFAFMFGGAWL